jgi:hypothetical protein
LLAIPSNTEVSTVVGGYRVLLHGELHVVDKRRRCTCRRPSCGAIKAVATYLRAGGPRAPDLATSPPSPVVCCPICQAVAHGSIESRNWQCAVDRTHYFLWRVQRFRQAREKALASAPPYVHEVLAAFASDEARAAFLSKHALAYPAGA